MISQGLTNLPPMEWINNCLAQGFEVKICREAEFVWMVAKERVYKKNEAQYIISIFINPPRMKKTCSLVGFSVAKLEVPTICKVYVKAM